MRISRTTVKKYFGRLKDSGVEVDQVLDMNDKELCELLQVKEAAPISTGLQVLEQLLPLYCKRLKRKGVTRKMLYDEYREKHPDGYSHSRFCDL